MSNYTVLAVKNVMIETDIQAKTKEEALAIAQKMDSDEFSEISGEHSWKIKIIYENNENILL